MTARDATVDLNGVARRFGRRWVLRGVDLVAHAGEAVALMGSNGSGKTTLLRVVATLLRPTRGTMRVLGFALPDQAGQVREHIGLLGHQAGLYEDLTASENLRFSLRMAGLPQDRAAIDRILDRVGLHGERDHRVRGFSAGMRRRLALGRLMLRPPRLLLLDEPYAAFDAAGVSLVNQFAQEITTAGGTAVIVTHDLERARGTVNRVLVLEQGRVGSQ